MSTISSVGKVAYIYDKGADTWFPVAGSTNPAANISWSGTHAFQNSTIFASALTSRAGINNFANAAERTSLMGGSIQNGVTSFLRDTNESYYYFNGEWRLAGDNANLSAKTANFSLALVDSGKTLDVESSTSVTITIPKNSTVPFPVGTQFGIIQTGAGQVSFAGEDIAVTILSKNSNKKISSRYSPATLIKRSENTWILLGDLTA